MVKHNKKRNTAFLYQILLREAGEASVEKNINKKRKVISIIREFFNKNTQLGQDLRLYQELTEHKGVPVKVSSRTVQEVLRERKIRVNPNDLFNEQTQLIDTINKQLGESVFSNFVKDYRILGSVYQLFNFEGKIKDRITLEESIAARMSKKDKKKKDTLQPIDKLTFNIFVEKFNEKFGKVLNESQKRLLQKYMMSFGDYGLSFKNYLNEEISRLKEILEESVSMKEIQEDGEMGQKTKDVISLLESYNHKNIDKDTILEVMKIQSLVEEIQDGD